MTNPTFDVPLKTFPRSNRRVITAADGVTMFAGQIVGVNAAGFAAPWEGSTAAFISPGLCREGVTGDVSGGTGPKCQIVHGETLRGVAVTDATQAGIDDPVYAADGGMDSLTLTPPATPAGPIGRLMDFRSATDCDVEMLTPGEFLAASLP